MITKQLSPCFNYRKESDSLYTMPKLIKEETYRNKTLTAWGLLIACSLTIMLIKLRADAGAWTLLTISTPSLWLTGILWLGHTFISILLLLILVLKNRITAYILFPIILFFWLISLYIQFGFGFIDYSEQVCALLGTSWDELGALITPRMIIWSAVIFITLEIGIYFFIKTCSFLFQGIRSVWIILFALLYVSVTSAAVLICEKHCPERLLPILYGLDNLSCAEKKKESLATAIQNTTCPAYAKRVLIPFYRQIYFPWYVYKWYTPSELKKSEEITISLNDKMGKDLVVVLFIGESYRSDHAAWNGYHRMTLPCLSAHKNNIINFPFFASYATSTASSIYGMLTDATCNHRKAEHTSFLGLMKKAGFSTHLLLCRTTHWEYVPSIYEAIDNKLDEVHMLHNSKEIENKVKELSSKGGKKIILIEDGTGHAPYIHESEFSKFGESTIDLYDNALLQTDDLISRVVSALSEEEAVMVYASDHGQSFGEDGCYMHGGALNRTEQRHVFAFLWASDIYADKQKEMLNNIKNNSRKYLSHDDIYFSILSLSGIECQEQKARTLNFTLPLENRQDESIFQLKD